MGCHFLLQGDLPDPGIKSRSPALQKDTLPSEPPGKPTQTHTYIQIYLILKNITRKQSKGQITNKGPVKWGFSSSSFGKESVCNAGDPGSIHGLERSPGEGIGYPIQYSCLEKSIDRGAYCKDFKLEIWQN